MIWFFSSSSKHSSVKKLSRISLGQSSDIYCSRKGSCHQKWLPISRVAGPPLAAKSAGYILHGTSENFIYCHNESLNDIPLMSLLSTQPIIPHEIASFSLLELLETSRKQNLLYGFHFYLPCINKRWLPIFYDSHLQIHERLYFQQDLVNGWNEESRQATVRTAKRTKYTWVKVGIYMFFSISPGTRGYFSCDL